MLGHFASRSQCSLCITKTVSILYVVIDSVLITKDLVSSNCRFQLANNISRAVCSEMSFDLRPASISTLKQTHVLVSRTP